MTYVVLNPNSNTNPSDRYRVAPYGPWLEFVNGGAAAYPFEGFATHEEADQYAATLNQGEVKTN